MGNNEDRGWERKKIQQQDGNERRILRMGKKEDRGQERGLRNGNKKIEGKKGKKLSMGKKVYTRMYIMGKKGEDEGWGNENIHGWGRKRRFIS